MRPMRRRWHLRRRRPMCGELDACGVCNGPGEIYECGCADIPEGDCDCDGNVLDECGIWAVTASLPETATVMATAERPRRVRRSL